MSILFMQLAAGMKNNSWNRFGSIFQIDQLAGLTMPYIYFSKPIPEVGLDWI